MSENVLDFFLGAPTPNGFFNCFAQALPSADSGTAVLLKGAPGSGKSTLLQEAALALVGRGQAIERIHCAADPASLDGVLCPAQQWCALDATMPHALEPLCPDAFEQVLSLHPCICRTKLLAHRAELLRLIRLHQAHKERAERCLTAAGSLLQDDLRTAQCCTNTPKAAGFAQVLAKRYLPHCSFAPREDVRLLSAVTPDGLVFFTDTLTKTAHTIVVLEDEYGAVGRVLMSALRAEALRRGHHVITCYCSLYPHEKIEHLLLPQIGVAFATSNSRHPVHIEGQRTIHARRFMQKEGLQLRRRRLRFNKKATKELMTQAVDAMADAKAVHDQIETLYRLAFCPQEAAKVHDTFLHILKSSLPG